MIKINMDMPKDCDTCKFRQLRGRDCFLNPESNEYMTYEEQYKHCPLIEVKDDLDKAVAAEAICDEIMSRFDVSATYGYDFAEAAINRMEAMAKELEIGEQE